MFEKYKTLITMNENNEKSFRNLFYNCHGRTYYYGIEFDDNKSCSDFIYEFLERSGKSETHLYDAIKEIEKKYSFRLNHIKNTFLLGIYLYQECNTIRTFIDKEIDLFKLKEKDNTKNFQYIWFLICMFHDLGYAQESKSLQQTEKKEMFDLKKIELKEISGVPPELYDINILLNYLNYRRDRYDCIDHGIYAGLIFYRDLCEIRRNMSSECNNQSGLYFGKELEKVYNFAAWIISAHNIFFAKTDFDKKLYKKYKLNSLIIKQKDYPISLNAYPMFYLFCLVDSLEPIKVFRDKELLRSLFLTISDKELKIRSEIKCGCHSSYFDKVKSLNDWLTPVKELDNGVLCVNFNFSLFGLSDGFR